MSFFEIITVIALVVAIAIAVAIFGLWGRIEKKGQTGTAATGARRAGGTGAAAGGYNPAQELDHRVIKHVVLFLGWFAIIGLLAIAGLLALPTVTTIQGATTTVTDSKPDFSALIALVGSAIGALGAMLAQTSTRPQQTPSTGGDSTTAQLTDLAQKAIVARAAIDQAAAAKDTLKQAVEQAKQARDAANTAQADATANPGDATKQQDATGKKAAADQADQKVQAAQAAADEADADATAAGNDLLAAASQ